MTKNEARRAAEIMLAYADGKLLQARVRRSDSWWDLPNEEPLFNWTDQDYRIKPEPREWWVNPRNDQCAQRAFDEEAARRDGWIRVREVLDE